MYAVHLCRAPGAAGGATPRRCSGLLAAAVFCLILSSTAGALATPASDEAISEALQSRIIATQTTERLLCRGELVCGIAELPRFYALRAHRPAWVSAAGPLSAAEDLLNAIRDAGQDGLTPEDYHLATLRRLMGTATAAAAAGRPPDADLLADMELLLTDAFLTLGSHLAAGRVNPETLHPDWVAASRQGIALGDLLARAVESGRIEDALQALRPPHPEYRVLRLALQRYRDLDAQGGWPPLPQTATWSRGQTGETARLLQRRLEISGDARPAAAGAPEAQPALEEALRRFQARHGLPAGGRLDPPALAALNVPVHERLRQIELNLERWRWLPRELGARHIRVNVPDYTLQVLDADQLALKMRVVVGRDYRRTPAFSSLMDHVVLNPDWNIPIRIAVEDILPKARRDPGYIARERIRVFANWSRDAAELDPAGIDWSKITPQNFRFKLKKDPGAHNDLGRFKFMLPNKFSVYLHDTTSRRLFERNVRSYSSGCIRVEKPFDLAEYVLRDAPAWTGDAIRAAVASGERRTAVLPKRIPVHLLYLTAWVDGEGELQFRIDPYRMDPALDRALRDLSLRISEGAAGSEAGR
jgi:murein L,D-transpeptidase YcbB/YkuD